MKPTFSLCVYCGSRTGDSPAYAQAAQAVGNWIGQHQGQLIYGGGNNGLMGVVAQATAQAGGRVVGVITREPLGSQGFGFDPVMLIPKFGKTFAQLPVEVKNANSHRGQSAAAMVELIRERWLAN
jgi:predicted Rossmann-fold nucleotide-binding protein